MSVRLQSSRHSCLLFSLKTISESALIGFAGVGSLRIIVLRDTRSSGTPRNPALTSDCFLRASVPSCSPLKAPHKWGSPRRAGAHPWVVWGNGKACASGEGLVHLDLPESIPVLGVVTGDGEPRWGLTWTSICSRSRLISSH